MTSQRVANGNTISALNRVAAIIRKELTKEIIAQGHNLTGKLKDSIRQEIVKSGGDLSLDIFIEDYGIFVDRGVKASRIPYKPGSGRKTSKYINGLMDFVRKRGLATGDKEVKNIAFAIAMKHKKEGMPTRSSRRFSKNGKRLNFVQEALDRVVDDILEVLGGALELDRTIIIDNQIRDIQRTI